MAFVGMRLDGWGVLEWDLDDVGGVDDGEVTFFPFNGSRCIVVSFYRQFSHLFLHLFSYIRAQIDTRMWDRLDVHHFFHPLFT